MKSQNNNLLDITFIILVLLSTILIIGIIPYQAIREWLEDKEKVEYSITITNTPTEFIYLYRGVDKRGMYVTASTEEPVSQGFDENGMAMEEPIGWYRVTEDGIREYCFAVFSLYPEGRMYQDSIFLFKTFTEMSSGKPSISWQTNKEEEEEDGLEKQDEEGKKDDGLDHGYSGAFIFQKDE